MSMHDRGDVARGGATMLYLTIAQIFNQMKSLLTLLCLSPAFGAVHAFSGQLAPTLEVDTVLDNSNCKEEIRALEEEMEMLEEEISNIMWELDELLWTCPADSGEMMGTRLAIGSMFTSTQFFALDNWSTNQSPYFDGMFGNWTVQAGESWDPFPTNRGNVGLLVGWEADLSRVNSAQRLDAVDGTVSFAPFDTTSGYKSNAMHLGFVKFPLMGRIGRYSELGSGSLHFCAGIVPGIRYLGAIITRSSKGASETYEVSRNIGLRRFSLNSRIAVSAKNVELFMESSLISLFKDDTVNPVVYPLTFGISLSPMGY